MQHRQICAVLLCVLYAGLAVAAGKSPRYELSIRAGLPLDAALQELSVQTEIQLIFFSEITIGRRAPELSGEYTLDDAMSRLLEGSGLAFRYANDRTIEVREGPPPRPARSSARLRKSTAAIASASLDSMQEVQVVASAEQLVASRIPTPLSEIPQSVSVISSEQIRQQNSVDLGDVMRNTPGIATRRTSSLEESAFSRAFPVTSFHVDGGGALKPSINQITFYEGSPDLSEFDRIEVLRGSDALFSGNTNPGGTVSLVRKRPLHTPALDISTTMGSWNNYRVELDASGPLLDDGSLRGRVDAVYGTRDFFFDRAHLDRKKIFGALEYDFTPTASLTVGGSYQRDDALPLWNGFPLYTNGTDPHLPRSLGLAFDWAFYDTRAGQGYLQYRQLFGANWSLRINGSAGRSIVKFGFGDFGAFIDNRDGSLGPPTAQFNFQPDRYTQATMDVTLTGRLDLFGRPAMLAIGADIARIRGRQNAGLYAGIGPELKNALAFDPANYPDPRLTQKPLLGVNTRERSTQYGAFLSLQVDVSNALTVTGGARVASDHFGISGSAFIGPFEFNGLSNEYGNHNVITPFAALLYRIDRHFSWYASYADVYLTPNGAYVRADGSVLGPEHGVTLETGIKGAWRDGALNAALAAYRIDQRHAPVADRSVARTVNCCYMSGTVRSKGVDLDVDGELTPGWLIGSGYTYNMNQTADGSIPSVATPRHQLKIWTSKTLSGALERWTAGGSLRAQTAARGATYLDCTIPDCPVREGLSQRAYAVLDLRAAFALNPTWEMALNVNNVFDKRYYLSQTSFSAWYGEPRNFTVRIDAKF